MPIHPVVIQKRMRELGRIRLGQKGSKGQPEKLDTFRITSASRTLLEHVAGVYGGTVTDWTDAPDEGYFQVITDVTELQILFPPTFADDTDGTPTIPVSQDFELWSGGGCQRRCDGVVEAFTGKACLCNPDERACKPTTRMSFMLPEIPGLGVWRLESHGYNAAAELPGIVAVLARAAHEGSFIPAVLRLEHRTKKQDGQTRRFVVPVVDLPNVTVQQLVDGETTGVINAARPAPGKPALPAAGVAPPPERFDNDANPDFGQRPPLPEGEPQARGTDGGPGFDASTSVSSPSESGPLTPNQFKDLCGRLNYTRDTVKTARDAVFPGVPFKDLTDEQRGLLADALTKEAVA